MILIWSGWGILVLLFFVVGCVVGIPVASLFPQEGDIGLAVIVIMGGLVCGLGSFFLARKIESGESRAFIDEQTGQRIVVRRNAGSLFFIPTRYWAYVGPIVGIALGVLLMMSPSTEPSDSATTAVAPAPAPAVSPTA
ncbi:hypothetical protein [Brevundimonas sp. FT23042]|uniref:hypothetical protein n=1 Tax=Brevundimonas sp. FT23042 TaxID=3393749 RepID=UPI003B58A1A5